MYAVVEIVDKRPIILKTFTGPNREAEFEALKHYRVLCHPKSIGNYHVWKISFTVGYECDLLD